MRLAVNIDHIATLRQARKAKEPEPVSAEQAGAHGIVCHLRSDRRHIQERDLVLLRQVIKTKLNLEMAATPEMLAIARKVKPDVVSLVPESPNELTTQGGLDVIRHRNHLAQFIPQLQKAGIRVSIFVDPNEEQIKECRALGLDLIEINTGKYAEAEKTKEREKALAEIKTGARLAEEIGLEVHAGHGLDYYNILPIVEISQIKEFSIGFAIIARAVMVGLAQAIKEMLALVEK
ncbi:MAG: pyridoxine 5'-phosphate synthase [Candidatus Aminicenantes bacterium]|nr:MAG: pyridoxine 5'-phosphate synthase [Candidatus Aminicenantes bacterium]